MTRLLNGQEATAWVACLLSDRVHVYNRSALDQNQLNIWNQHVKISHHDPGRDPLSHVAEATFLLSSDALLPALPYLYQLVADKSSSVLHVSADCHATMSTFGDFTEVMAVRQTGMVFLNASSVQEAYDFSIFAKWISILASIPVLHFFDSKRISHESRSIDTVSKKTLLDWFPSEKHEQEPNSNILDVYKQVTDQFALVTKRSYAPLEYVGHPDAEFVIISMGAGACVVEHTLVALDKDLKLGALKVRLYRPWSHQALLDALPSTVKRIAVLEPTDHLACAWNPLFLDVAAAYQFIGDDNVDILSGQYGVEETDFSPKQVSAVYHGLASGQLDRYFKVSCLSPGTLQMPPSTVEQFIFIDGIDLAYAFVSCQPKETYVQLYTLNKTTFVRLGRSESDVLLPTLIDSADVVVLCSTKDESASIRALDSLVSGGLVAIQSDASLLPSGVKKIAHNKQANIASFEDLHVLLENNSLSHLSCLSSIVRVPDNWSTEAVSLASDAIESSPEPMSLDLPLETPYLNMLEQTFGSRLDIANAIHQPSVWSPSQSHPQAANPEFGYGRLVHRIQERTRFVDTVMQVIRNGNLPLDAVRVLSRWLLLVNSPTSEQHKIREVSDLVVRVLSSIVDVYPMINTLLNKKHLLYAQSHWLIGSDTWAYDLGQSGLHHAITSGENINILVVDTTPYSSSRTQEQCKKDIGLYAMNDGSVYVASVALYASYTGVLQALMEADAYKGVSVVLAYLPQVSGTFDALASLKETKISVDNGSWPLYRWNPASENNEFTLDSQRIKKGLEAFLARENYLSQLALSHPDLSNILVSSLETDIKKRHTELKSKARADYARLLSGLSATHGPPLTVLFGSDNGNAEAVAKKIAMRAKLRGAQVKLMAMDDYSDIQALSNETYLVLVCSTAGQGEFPSNARDFWKALNGLVFGDVDFSELKFGVLGLGDSHYWPREEDAAFYNKPAKTLDAKLETLGASQLLTVGLADDQDPDGYETVFNAWQSELWKALGVNESGSDEEPVYTDNQMKIDSNFLRGNIAEDLVDDSTGNVPETTQKLLKFHGTYLQDDRDLREERKHQGLEKAFSFLVRVRTPGGVATPKQWLAIDALSEKFGIGQLKLTTRQTFQIHGVLKRNLRSTIRGINKTLLSTLAACGDVSRNIMSTSLTEIPEVHAQVQTTVYELVDLLSPKTSAYHEIWLNNSMVAGHAVQDFEPLYGPSYLPRKFKVVIAVPPNNDVDVYAHDLGYIAIVDAASKQVVGYNVLIGGGMGQTHGNKKTYPRQGTMIGYIAAKDILKITEAVVSTQRDFGDRLNRKHARFKYTIDDRGLDFIINEIEQRSDVKLQEAMPFQFKDNVDPYGWTKGVDDTWNFCMFIENGRLKDTPDTQLKKGLRELAKFHRGEFRLTANQHLVIANIPESNLEKTKAHLAKYKMDNLSFSGIRKTSMACVALPTCGLAMAESERYLPQLVTRFEDIMEEAGLGDESIVVRMTGCPNGCSRPYLAELALVGKSSGTYNLYLGGSITGERLNKLYLENLNEQEILDAVKPIIKKYAVERDDGESFGEWVIRAGYVRKTITGLDFHD